MSISENTIKKALMVKEIVDQYYEPERLDRSMVNIYRKHVIKVYPISERTFWRLLKIANTVLKSRGQHN